MTKSVVILPNQLCKKDVLLLCCGDLPVQPLVIGCSGDPQLLAHPTDAPALMIVKKLNCYVFGLKSDSSKPHIPSNSLTFFSSSHNISFSSSCLFRRRFSRRRRSNSSTSSSLLWWPRLSSSPSSPLSRYFFTQEYT